MAQEMDRKSKAAQQRMLTRIPRLPMVGDWAELTRWWNPGSTMVHAPRIKKEMMLIQSAPPVKDWAAGGREEMARGSEVWRLRVKNATAKPRNMRQKATRPMRTSARSPDRKSMRLTMAETATMERRSDQPERAWTMVPSMSTWAAGTARRRTSRAAARAGALPNLDSNRSGMVIWSAPRIFSLM